MVGSAPSSGAPGAPIAKYKAPSCKNLADNSTVAGAADASYVLASENGAPVLYELDGSQNGARIDNHWTDDEGDHFFTYVKGRQAWHYVIPTDHQAPGKRLILLSYSTQESGGVIKPTGSPAISCDMVASK